MSHITGCLGSKVIVAINKDKEANIFSVAHFGIVADYKEVLPTLIAKLKELKSKKAAHLLVFCLRKSFTHFVIPGLISLP
jgi:electron transfer flavoprotein alpha subunit